MGFFSRFFTGKTDSPADSPELTEDIDNRLSEDLSESELVTPESVIESPDTEPASLSLEDRLLSELDRFFDNPDSQTGFIDPTSDNFSPDERKNQELPEETETLEWPPAPEPDSELGQIRELIMNRELAQLSFLTNILADPSRHAQAISQIITEAILIRSRHDDKLSTVLAPTVEKIVTASVRRNPEALASQIFPVIGPAIRRSISETFLSMLQNFNSTLEMSLSLKGLKWRLEAMRVHKPFSEIVMLHTLLYQVEEIYLIHAESGLILDHIVGEGDNTQDADMVAGMFTAIQDFIKDSFSLGHQETLDTLHFGERSIFIRRADQIYMACVVRGNPPTSLAQNLQSALELLMVDLREDLDNFDGNTKPFQKCRFYLMDFLEARYQDTHKKLPLVIRLAPALAILIVLLMGGIYLYNRQIDYKYTELQQLRQIELKTAHQQARLSESNRFLKALDLVDHEPGLVVTRVQPKESGIWEIACLQDRLARNPLDILTHEGGLRPDQFNLTSRPFVSLDYEIVKKRIFEELTTLPTVNMDFEQNSGRLVITGTAPLGWIISLRERALAMPGIYELDTSGLLDPRTTQLNTLLDKINGVVIYFPTNSDEPIPEDLARLVEAVDNLVILEKLASEMQVSVSLIIYGHADSVGQARRNFELSEQRTKTVAALLYAKGSSLPISSYGLGAQFSAQGDGGHPVEDQDSRKIELRVHLAQAAPLNGSLTMSDSPGGDI